MELFIHNKEQLLNADSKIKGLYLTTIQVNFDVNYRQFKEDFVFALMKCSYAAFGEQNKMIALPKLQIIGAY